MSTYELDRINIIVDRFHNLPNELIINILGFISPVYLMYLELVNPEFGYYNQMLPTQYFDIFNPNVLDVIILHRHILDIININSTSLLSMIKTKFIRTVYEYQQSLDDDNMESLRFIRLYDLFLNTIITHIVTVNNIEMAQCIVDLKDSFKIITECCNQNNYNLFEILINYIINKKYVINEMTSNDLITKCFIKNIDSRFMLKYIDISFEFPKIFVTNFMTIFFHSLTHGRADIMDKAIEISRIENKNIIWRGMYQNEVNLYKKLWVDYFWDHEIDFLQYADSIIFAIMGKNLICVQEMYNFYINNVNTEINAWKKYIFFASSNGTLEILQYFIRINPNGINLINDFYGKVLMCALLNVNQPIVQFAINNGAVLKENMISFIQNYNLNYRNSFEAYNIPDWYSQFHQLRAVEIEDYDIKYVECLELLPM